MSLFGGLQVKASSSSSATATSSVDDQPPDSVSHEEQVRVDEDVDPSQNNNHAAGLISSGFSFLSKTDTEESAQEVSKESAPSAFGFLAGDVSTSETAPTVSGTSFGFISNSNHNDGDQEEESADQGANHHREEEDLSAASLAAAQAVQQDADLLAPVAVIIPANIKKKRGARRPGFERARENSTGSVNNNSDDGRSIDAERVPVPARKDSNSSPTPDNDAVDENINDVEISPPQNPILNEQVENIEKIAQGQELDEQETKAEGIAKTDFNSNETVTLGQSNSQIEAEEEEARSEEGEEINLSNSGEMGEVLQAFKRVADKFARDLVAVNTAIEEKEHAQKINEQDTVSLNERILALQADQNAALDAEDFDKADQLQRTIEAVTRSLEEVCKIRASLSRDMTKLLKEREVVFADRKSGVEILEELLGDSSSSAIEQAIAKRDQVLKSAEQERKRLVDEEDLLKIQMEGIESDVQVVNSELAQINEKVDAGTTELREQRVSWESKIAFVDEEIQELERQLKAKRIERLELNESLEEVMAGISAVRSKYESRLSELDTRQKDVENKQSTVQKCSEVIQTSRAELEQQCSEAESDVVTLQVASKEISTQLSIFSSALSVKNDSVPPGSEGNDHEELGRLEDQIQVNGQTVKKISLQVQSLEEQIVAEGRKIIDIESILPGLNDQKAIAVSSRNFKEAGRIAATLKSMSSQKEELESKIGDLKEELGQLTQKINDKQSENDQATKRLEAIRGGLAKAILKDLSKRIKLLRSTIEKVELAGNTSKGSFGAMVLRTLNIELETCENQRKSTLTKFGGQELDDEDEDSIAQSQLDNGPVLNDGSSDEQQISPQTDPEVMEAQSPVDLSALQEEINTMEDSIAHAVESEDYERAAELDEALVLLRSRFEKAYEAQGSDSQNLNERTEISTERSDDDIQHVDESHLGDIEEENGAISNKLDDAEKSNDENLDQGYLNDKERAEEPEGSLYDSYNGGEDKEEDFNQNHLDHGHLNDSEEIYESDGNQGHLDRNKIAQSEDTHVTGDSEKNLQDVHTSELGDQE